MNTNVHLVRGLHFDGYEGCKRANEGKGGLYSILSVSKEAIRKTEGLTRFDRLTIDFDGDGTTMWSAEFHRTVEDAKRIYFYLW